MDSPTKMDDLGVPPFMETSTYNITETDAKLHHRIFQPSMSRPVSIEVVPAINVQISQFCIAETRTSQTADKETKSPKARRC